jgi:hypothetical protein
MLSAEYRRFCNLGNIVGLVTSQPRPFNGCDKSPASSILVAARGPAMHVSELLCSARPNSLVRKVLHVSLSNRILCLASAVFLLDR